MQQPAPKRSNDGARAQTASDALMQACGVTSRFAFVWMIEKLSQGSCCSRQPNFIIISLALQQVNSLAAQVA
jgi:hypothetical protein